METEIITIKPTKEEIDQAAIDRAAEIIKRGGLVVFPTETVYGLGADATDADAAKKIYAAKGRPSDNPLIIHIAEPSDAENYAVTNECYYALARAFMPGPLTVILPKKDIIPHSVTGGLDTVAVRCPSHPIAHKLIVAADTPIAAPSANISGKPSPTSPEHVIYDMSGKVDMIISGGDCEIGLESTIVLLNDNKAILLRPGAITPDALRCVCEEVEIAPTVAEQLSENERPLSPGMKYKHYAPSAPLVLLDGEESAVLEFLKTEQTKKNCIILCYSEEKKELCADRLIDIGARDDIISHAHRLFSALREADKRENAEVIYAHLPDRDGLGLALYNRMIRAAAHTVKHII